MKNNKVSNMKENQMKLKPAANRDRGSVLILTMMAVLVLSVLVSGLLSVGTTEIYTTQNYHLKKSAYYTAVKGVEEIRNLIYNYPDAESVKSVKRYSIGLEGPMLAGENPVAGTFDEVEGLKRYYITGSMADMEKYDLGNDSVNSGSLQQIDQMKGFDAPPLPAFSMGGSASIVPVVWNVTITAQVKAGSRKAYAEVTSGVYSVLTISY